MAQPLTPLDSAPLLSLPPARALWKVGWPVVALGLLRSGFFLVNSAWVGFLGHEALEGQAGASFATWIIHTWADMTAVGLLALVARAVGAGSRERVRELATQGVWLALVLAAVPIAVSSFAPEAYFRLLGYKGAEFGPALAAGTGYLRVLLLGSPTTMLVFAMNAVFRGIGDTRTPLRITAGTLLLNLALDPLLMFGPGPLPALGVAGAALASVIADGVGSALGLFLLARHGVSPKLAWPEPRTWASIVRISLPMTTAGFGFCLVYVLLGPIVTKFGPGAMAALGVGHRIESIAYLFAWGMGMAVATLVGQNLGARTADRARRTVAAAERINAAVLLPLATLFYIAAPWVFALFTGDPAIQRDGAGYLRWNSLVLLFMGFEILYEEAFAGAGHTLPPLLVSMPLTAARIPLAWLLSQRTDLGVDGIWIAIALSTLVKGILIRWAFRRGTWARKLGMEV